jgi:hypothetical protein
MLIHLADASANRGQYDCLVSEQFRNHLFSFEYRKAFGPFFENVWDEMNIHLAGLPSQNQEIQSKTIPAIRNHLSTYADQHEINAKLDAMNIHLAGHTADAVMDGQTKPHHPNHLTTYADQKEVRDTIGDSTDRVPDLRPRVIIDSGAFTAFTTGKTIDPRDYGKWALEFKQRWEPKLAALHFMNLDVIGDQDASWENQAILEALGLKPLPIVTYGADKRHLIRAIENYHYIALGGLVPWSRQKDKLKSWLDYCFSIVMAHNKKNGVMPRVHLLGITTDWVLKRYPCYSSDSSSWVSCLRFGGGAAAGIKQLPRYKASEGAMAATIHTLKSEIRKYKKMELEATNLWSKRGVKFDD